MSDARLIPPDSLLRKTSRPPANDGAAPDARLATTAPVDLALPARPGFEDAPPDNDTFPPRPRTWGECLQRHLGLHTEPTGDERKKHPEWGPCPYASCTKNLLVEVGLDALSREYVRELGEVDQLIATCSLREADRTRAGGYRTRRPGPSTAAPRTTPGRKPKARPAPTEGAGEEAEGSFDLPPHEVIGARLGQSREAARLDLLSGLRKVLRALLRPDWQPYAMREPREDAPTLPEGPTAQERAFLEAHGWKRAKRGGGWIRVEGPRTRLATFEDALTKAIEGVVRSAAEGRPPSARARSSQGEALAAQRGGRERDHSTDAA
ncbi:MAG: hypothetical protein JNK72_24965 [Myxococcales bacterium]|nr:hypothetical protein [Myxococcales bacterium]